MDTNIYIKIMIVLVVLLVYFIINLLKKNEKQEEIIDLQETHILSINTLAQTFIEKWNEVDRIGAFRNDDETGVFWNQINQMKDLFKEYLIERNKHA